MKAAGILVWGLAVCLATAVTVSAQTPPAGALTVTVIDPSGAAISGARLILTAADTRASRSATADNAGRASFRGVASGRYAVKGERAGFAPGRVDDVAIAGDEVTLQIQLELQTLSEAVNVLGGPATYVTAAPPSGTKTDIPIRDMPQAIEVRTLQMLTDLGGTRSSYEVAKTVAGLFSAENGQGDPGRNVPNFFFRGFGNAGVYLKDGHAVNGWMSTFDTANTERVEFLSRRVSLVDYRGRPVLLTSWATWCVECRKELPPLVEAWQSRRERGLVVIAVNLDARGEAARVAEMIRSYSLGMPIWSDESGGYSAVFEAPGVPTSVLLDRNGVLVRRWIGRVDFRAEDVTKPIDSLLAR